MAVTPASLTSTGTVSLLANNIDLATMGSFTVGNGQSVVLNSPNTISIWGPLNTFSVGNGPVGGSVTIQTPQSIIAQGINTSAQNNFGGNITLSAGGGIVAQNLNSVGFNNTSGTVTVGSTGSSVSLGSINTTNDHISANVTISASTYANVGAISTTTSGGDASGNVSIVANGAISTGAINTIASSQTSGSIDLVAGSTLSASDLTAAGSGAVSGSIGLAAPSNISTGSLDVSSVGDSGASGGNIITTSGGGLTTGQINAFGVSGTGYVLLSASGSILTGNISTSVSNSGSNAGNVSVTAGGSLVTGSVNASNVTTAFGGQGGNVTLIGNTSVTTRDISTLDVNEFGSNAGNVIVVSPSGAININGFINTTSLEPSVVNSPSTLSGSVALTAAGTISAYGINTSNGNLTAGNIFVSSGSNAASAVSVGRLDTSSGSSTAGTNGTIYLGANVGTFSKGFSASGNLNIAFSLVNSESGTKTTQAYLFSNLGQNQVISGSSFTISDNTTSGFNIYPGVYTTIGASGSPTALTLSLGGDSRTIVPIVSTGDMYLNGLNANNTVGGSLQYQLNGYTAEVVSGGPIGITLSNNLTTNAQPNGTAGNVGLIAMGSGSVNSTAPTISGNSLALYSEGHSVTATTTISPISLFAGNAGSITISDTVSNANISSAFAGSSSTLSITNAGNINIAGPAFAGIVLLTATSPASFAFANITTNSVVYANSVATIKAGSSSPIAGDITLNNTVFSPLIQLTNAAGSIGGSGLLDGSTVFATSNSGLMNLNALATTVTAQTSGNVTINTFSPTLNFTSANGGSGSVFTVTGNSNIAVGAVTISGAEVSMTTTGDITANASATFAATGSLNLVAGGNVSLPGTVNTGGGLNSNGANISMTGYGISTGAIFSNGLGAGQGGSISLTATNANVVTGAGDNIQSTGSSGGNITISAANGISIGVLGNLGNLITTANTLAGGNVTLTTGSSTNSATILTGNITTSGGTSNVANGGSVVIADNGSVSSTLSVGNIQTSVAGGTNTGGGTVNVTSSGTLVTGSITTSAVYGGSQYLSSTGGTINTGALNANGSTGQGGSISLIATNGGVSTLANSISSTGQSGGDVTIVSTAGINVTPGSGIAIDTAGSAGSGGNVILTTGLSSNSVALTTGSITTTGTTNGGLVMLVNSESSTAITALTVGTITTDASGANGHAGPVALVATGEIIETGNISAQALTGASSMGGSLFISSGGTGATAIDIQGATVSTNAAGTAGSIIMLTQQPASSKANPTNITTPVPTFTGGVTSGTYLNYGLFNASSTVPAALNITPFAGSINIRPGGYQQVTGSSGSPIALSINENGDTQMVAPINIGAFDGSTNSLYVTSITQTTGLDNIALVTSRRHFLHWYSDTGKRDELFHCLVSACVDGGQQCH